jgi:hypothetical protein
LLVQSIPLAVSRALLNAGRSILASIPIIAMTTKSSMSVNRIKITLTGLFSMISGKSFFE